MRKIGFVVILLLLLATQPAISENGLYGDALSKESISLEELEIISSIINPDNLGLSEINSGNIVVDQMGTDAAFSHETNAEMLREIVKELKGEAYEVVIFAMKDLMSNTRYGLNTEKVLSLYEIHPIYANVDARDYVSYQTIIFEAPADILKLELVEVLDPKTITNETGINFTKGVPKILSHEPYVLFWEFTDLKRGDKIEISYYANNLIVGTEDTHVLAVAEIDGYFDQGPGNSITGFVSRNTDRYKIDFEIDHNPDVASNFVFVSIIIVLGIIFGIFIMELEGRGSLHGLKNMCCDAEAFFRIGFKNKKIIDSYINDCIHKGYHLDDIRISLLRAGWNRQAVNTLLNKYK